MICARSVMRSSKALAASASAINQNIEQALTGLYQDTPGASALAQKSKGILVFPNIVKAGFIVAGQYGDGVLRIRDQPVGYYRLVAASVGYQAGVVPSLNVPAWRVAKVRAW
jgi:lipid-binding SYLF domain-containing protein